MWSRNLPICSGAHMSSAAVAVIALCSGATFGGRHGLSLGGEDELVRRDGYAHGHTPGVGAKPVAGLRVTLALLNG